MSPVGPSRVGVHTAAGDAVIDSTAMRPMLTTMANSNTDPLDKEAEPRRISTSVVGSNLDSDYDSDEREPTHVSSSTPISDTSYGGNDLKSSPASVPATCYRPRRESVRRPSRSLHTSPPASPSTVDNAASDSRRARSRSSSLSPDRSFAFQTATRAQGRPHTPVEMTCIVPTQRKSDIDSSAPAFLHQNSRSRLLGPPLDRLDPEAPDCLNSRYNRSSKRLLGRKRQRVKLVLVYSFIFTVFVLAAGLYPFGAQLYRKERNPLVDGTAIEDTTTDLDTVLRCNIDMSEKHVQPGNSGVNALSDVIDIQRSTGASLSSDIWGWKKHQRGIVYASSHNDEMHGDRAFTHAYSLGLAAIEADVWLVPAASHPELTTDRDSILLVGHEDRDLQKARTLKKIYLDPIWEILERANEGNNGCGGWKGVFTDRGVPDQTLLLLIDTKNEVDSTYAELRRLLTPFAEKGYLSHFVRTSPDSDITDGKLTLGPLTVIGTGDTPINSILSENPRYIFKDAPLTMLNQPILYPNPKTGDLVQVDWHPSFAPMASAKFSIASHASYFTSSFLFLPIRQAFRLAFSTPAFLAHADPSKFVREAHAKGIESRWWGMARHPRPLRWALWAYVKDMGTDWLNADDLEDVAEFSRRRTEDDRLST